MTEYIVTSMETGKEITRYRSPTGQPIEFDGMKFSETVHTPTTDPVAAAFTSPTDWLIDIGPFFDRFGAAKIDILASPSPVVQAIVKDCTVRRWIDLRLDSVAQAMGALRSLVPSLTQEIVNATLNSPVQPTENLALRKTYFQ